MRRLLASPIKLYDQADFLGLELFLRERERQPGPDHHLYLLDTATFGWSPKAICDLVAEHFFLLLLITFLRAIRETGTARLFLGCLDAKFVTTMKLFLSRIRKWIGHINYPNEPVCIFGHFRRNFIAGIPVLDLSFFFPENWPCHSGSRRKIAFNSGPLLFRAKRDKEAKASLKKYCRGQS